MSREKQIEEITKITCPAYHRNKEKKCAGIQECDMKCLHYLRCESLYNEGYRKQVEGEWIWTEKGEADCEKYWVCSACKEHDFVKTKYCPNCGARMRGGKNEQHK